MTANPEPLVQPVEHEFQSLLAYVTGPNARSQTASTVALTRFRRRLAVGAARWRLFLVTRASVRPATPVTAPDGTALPDHAPRPTMQSLATCTWSDTVSRPLGRRGAVRSTRR